MLRKQLLLKSLVALIAICITTSAVNAEIVVRPPGLAPNVPYRLVFVLSGTVNAQSSDINYYNGVVATAAAAIPELAGLKDPWGNTVTWKAVVSTTAVDAIDNTGTAGNGTWDDVAIYNFSGVKVADNNADLWDGSIDAAINRTETDQSLAAYVWTGSNTSGREYISGGSGAVGEFNTIYGDSALTGKDWINTASTGSQQQYHLYAMSSVVPEPSTLIMWTVLAGIGLAVLRRKRAAA